MSSGECGCVFSFLFIEMTCEQNNYDSLLSYVIGFLVFNMDIFLTKRLESYGLQYF